MRGATHVSARCGGRCRGCLCEEAGRNTGEGRGGVLSRRALEGVWAKGGSWRALSGGVVRQPSSATTTMRRHVPAEDFANLTEALSGLAVDGTHVSPFVMWFV